MGRAGGKTVRREELMQMTLHSIFTTHRSPLTLTLSHYKFAARRTTLAHKKRGALLHPFGCHDYIYELVLYNVELNTTVHLVFCFLISVFDQVFRFTFVNHFEAVFCNTFASQIVDSVTSTVFR